MSAQPVSTVGDVTMALFPQRNPAGHEQQGPRPCVIVGIPEATGQVRYSMMVVVPFTTALGQAWAARNPLIYPLIKAGTGGLPNDSVALLDQITTLDSSRFMRRLGTLSPEQLALVQGGLRRIFQL